MWEHFAAHCKEVHRLEVARGSRGGQRLLEACERMRKLLSTLCADPRPNEQKAQACYTYSCR